jgi:nucleotide-binding universal stress UspA family protein
MYTRILVPLDGSSLAEAILPHAVAIAQRFGATLVLLRVGLSEAQAVRQTLPGEPVTAAPLSLSVAHELAESQQEAAIRYLQGVGQDLDAAKVKHEAIVMDGDPVLALRQAVREQSINLVTMATHGRSTLGRLLQGSVAEDLLHEIGVPVLMLHVKT